MNWLVIILGPLLASAIITPLARSFFVRFQLGMPRLRRRDVHTKPIPRLGGLVLALVFWASVGLILMIKPSILQLTTNQVVGIDRNILGVLLGSLIAVLVGLIDDLYGLPPGLKLLGQIVAAAMLPLFDVRVQGIANPFGGASLLFNPFVDGLVAILWIVFVMNVINLLDGLDGLAAGVSSVSLLILALLSLAPFVNQPALAVLMLLIFGAVLGFLPSNWHPAQLFLGDSGSQLLGYLLGVAAIISGGKLAAAALVLSFPILDLIWAVLRRVSTGRSPFSADREHLHHRLLALGFSQPVIVIFLICLSGIFGWIALTSRTAGKIQAFLVASGLMVVILVVLSLIERWRQRTHATIDDKKGA